MIALFLVMYFTSLVAFVFVSHPVIYCILLVLGSLSACGVIYLVVGFSWYLVLFSLVYVGGVYVLFIFVSVHEPNPVPSFGIGLLFVLLFSSFFLGGFLWFLGFVPCFVESSHYLCSCFEGLTYCFFCLVLLAGFLLVSVVLGCKDSFFR
uniref:NADH dehydrogenase subunit 6 n=1 Tax=Lyperosomum longicauda TaxID=2714089 RepID=A0A6H0YBV2_9TREM|nr:NADH dehydrogenase subunit 6 [Lyperosomum longicauda]QIX04659.1 NADH dehydrogenase subunit 6 [Lyperosomum longicauda]